MPNINSPGSPRCTKASPELLELADAVITATGERQRMLSLLLAAACEAERCNVFRLLEQVRGAVS